MKDATCARQHKTTINILQSQSLQFEILARGQVTAGLHPDEDEFDGENRWFFWVVG